MTGRTYRYFEGEVLYPFGYGLSYTTFEYQNLMVSPSEFDQPGLIQVSFEVVNTGKVSGDEVIQIYLRDVEATVPVPRHSLVGFRRVHLAPGERAYVSHAIEPKQFACVTDDGQWTIEPGQFTIFVGGGQPGSHDVLSVIVSKTGSTITLKS
jgi:beta-glucosidase